MSELTCFKSYDVRGEYGVNIDEKIVYRIGRAVAQHFGAKSVIIGFDARETSLSFAAAASRGVRDTGSDVINIGLAGTEEMYWAVTHFNSCAGIEITASHNPINYNGMKIVKSESRPLADVDDFQVIKKLAETENWEQLRGQGFEHDRAEEARSAYVDRILSFVDVSTFNPLKIVVNSGNGAAGPTFDAIAERLALMGCCVEFFRVNHEPDPTFPNGIPNPLLPKNHASTADAVKSTGADFGIAFDGDFDRCFFFDEHGAFVQGGYIVGILASIFLEKEIGAKIVHDPRIIWNTQNIIAANGGQAVQSKSGHAFMKHQMRDHAAVYGGEVSAHHYFRDFSYCDSGMIPWLLVAELISCSGRSLGEWVKERAIKFPSSDEVNFTVEDPAASIKRIMAAYGGDALSIDETDGVSLTFDDWRFNIRCSSTEPLLRLNIEAKGGNHSLNVYEADIANLIGGFRV